MLRGEVPQDRDPKEIIFNSIKESEDVWSNLVYAMMAPEDYGEIWYYNGTYRKHRLAPNLIERWVPSFKTHKSLFVPDIIFCRGGFKEYHHILNKFPNAFKIRYGAGRRYLPCQGFYGYDLILQDSIEQLVYKTSTRQFILSNAKNKKRV